MGGIRLRRKVFNDRRGRFATRCRNLRTGGDSEQPMHTFGAWVEAVAAVLARIFPRVEAEYSLRFKHPPIRNQAERSQECVRGAGRALRATGQKFLTIGRMPFNLFS